MVVLTKTMDAKQPMVFITDFLAGITVLYQLFYLFVHL